MTSIEQISLRDLLLLLDHFDVGGNLDADSADISLTCERCPWNTWLPVPAMVTGQRLGHLVRLALKHYADCPGPGVREAQ